MYVIMQPIIDPVARMTIARFVLALSVLLSLRTSTIDFQNAFLNVPLCDDVYVYAPPGSVPLPDGMVYKLHRAMYGLKQSPGEWNIKLDDILGTYCLICLSVDDLIVAYTNKAFNQTTIYV